MTLVVLIIFYYCFIANSYTNKMQKQRVLSVVEGTWGRGTLYDIDHQFKTPEPSHAKIPVTSAMGMSHRQSISIPSFLHQPPDKSSPDLQAEDDQDKEDYCLPYFKASLFATILEDTITEFRILLECNNEMRISKTMSDWGLLRALKYEVEQPVVTDELDGINTRALGCNEYKLNKLDTDRTYFGEVLVNLYKELTLNKCFKVLLDYNLKIAERDKYRAFLADDEAKNKVLRKDLYKQLRQQRIHIKSVIYDADVVIDGLRTQVEDASLMAETCGRYVGYWQNARTEQHHQVILDKEAVYNDSIQYYKQRSDHEQRVHAEVELLTNIIINETLQKVEEWMDKYEKDIEQIDLNIFIKKNDYISMLEKRRHYESTIEMHDKAMKDWNKFKDDREKARQYVDKMNKSAIIVQAWWRGLLVRKQLGPYKPTKKKGGAPPKKK